MWASVSVFFFALNVKVVRNSEQARRNDRRSHDSHNGSHVCSESQSGSKQARVNGRSNHDPLVCGVLCPLSSCSLVSLMLYMYIYMYIYLWMYIYMFCFPQLFQALVETSDTALTVSAVTRVCFNAKTRTMYGIAGGRHGANAEPPRNTQRRPDLGT